jgi:hypothetical protein
MPIAIDDDAELFLLAAPLDPLDRTQFAEYVVAQFGAHTEIDVGLVNRVAAPIQRKYLGFMRGSGTGWVDRSLFTMDRIVARLNILHFRRLLDKNSDEVKRRMLVRLLADEGEKLKALESTDRSSLRLLRKRVRARWYLRN